MSLSKAQGAQYFSQTPWLNHYELQQVYRSLYDFKNPSRQQKGVDYIHTLRNRTPKLALAIESTVTLIQLQQQAQEAQLSYYNNPLTAPINDSTHLLRYSLSLALLRFVNGFVDSMQLNSKNANSVLKLATNIDMPRILVDIRHSATHNELPSFETLLLATNQALLWVHSKYWKPTLTPIMVLIKDFSTTFSEIYHPLVQLSKLIPQFIKSNHIEGQIDRLQTVHLNQTVLFVQNCSNLLKLPFQSRISLQNIAKSISTLYNSSPIGGNNSVDDGVDGDDVQTRYQQSLLNWTNTQLYFNLHKNDFFEHILHQPLQLPPTTDLLDNSIGNQYGYTPSIPLTSELLSAQLLQSLSTSQHSQTVWPKPHFGHIFYNMHLENNEHDRITATNTSHRTHLDNSTQIINRYTQIGDKLLDGVLKNISQLELIKIPKQAFDPFQSDPNQLDNLLPSLHPQFVPITMNKTHIPTQFKWLLQFTKSVLEPNTPLPKIAKSIQQKDKEVFTTPLERIIEAITSIPSLEPLISTNSSQVVSGKPFQHPKVLSKLDKATNLHKLETFFGIKNAFFLTYTQLGKTIPPRFLQISSGLLSTLALRGDLDVELGLSDVSLPSAGHQSQKMTTLDENGKTRENIKHSKTKKASKVDQPRLKQIDNIHNDVIKFLQHGENDQNEFDSLLLNFGNLSQQDSFSFSQSNNYYQSEHFFQHFLHHGLDIPMPYGDIMDYDRYNTNQVDNNNNQQIGQNGNDNNCDNNHNRINNSDTIPTPSTQPNTASNTPMSSPPIPLQDAPTELISSKRLLDQSIEFVPPDPSNIHQNPLSTADCDSNLLSKPLVKRQKVYDDDEGSNQVVFLPGECPDSFVGEHHGGTVDIIDNADNADSCDSVGNNHDHNDIIHALGEDSASDCYENTTNGELTDSPHQSSSIESLFGTLNGDQIQSGKNKDQQSFQSFIHLFESGSMNVPISRPDELLSTCLSLYAIITYSIDVILKYNTQLMNIVGEFNQLTSNSSTQQKGAKNKKVQTSFPAFINEIINSPTSPTSPTSQTITNDISSTTSSNTTTTISPLQMSPPISNWGLFNVVSLEPLAPFFQDVEKEFKIIPKNTKSKAPSLPQTFKTSSFLFKFASIISICSTVQSNTIIQTPADLFLSSLSSPTSPTSPTSTPPSSTTLSPTIQSSALYLHRLLHSQAPTATPQHLLCLILVPLLISPPGSGNKVGILGWPANCMEIGSPGEDVRTFEKVQSQIFQNWSPLLLPLFMTYPGLQGQLLIALLTVLFRIDLYLIREESIKLFWQMKTNKFDERIGLKKNKKKEIQNQLDQIKQDGIRLCNIAQNEISLDDAYIDDEDQDWDGYESMDDHNDECYDEMEQIILKNHKTLILTPTDQDNELPAPIPHAPIETLIELVNIPSLFRTNPSTSSSTAQKKKTELKPQNSMHKDSAVEINPDEPRLTVQQEWVIANIISWISILSVPFIPTCLSNALNHFEIQSPNFAILNTKMPNPHYLPPNSSPDGKKIDHANTFHEFFPKQPISRMCPQYTVCDPFLAPKFQNSFQIFPSKESSPLPVMLTTLPQYPELEQNLADQLSLYALPWGYINELIQNHCLFFKTGPLNGQNTHQSTQVNQQSNQNNRNYGKFDSLVLSTLFTALPFCQSPLHTPTSLPALNKISGVKSAKDQFKKMLEQYNESDSDLKNNNDPNHHWILSETLSNGKTDSLFPPGTVVTH